MTLFLVFDKFFNLGDFSSITSSKSVWDDFGEVNLEGIKGGLYLPWQAENKRVLVTAFLPINYLLTTLELLKADLSLILQDDFKLLPIFKCYVLLFTKLSRYICGLSISLLMLAFDFKKCLFWEVMADDNRRCVYKFFGLLTILLFGLCNSLFMC